MWRRVLAASLYLAAMSSVATPAAAQQNKTGDSVSRSVHLGIRAGVSQATLKSDNPVDDFIWRRTLTAGIFVDRALTDRFGIRLDVSTLRMGGTNRRSGDRTTHFDFWRLAVPISGTFRLVSSRSLHGALVGGVAPGFRLHSELDRSDAGTLDVTSDSSFMSLSLLGGASLDIGAVRIDFQYFHGVKSQTGVSRILNVAMHDRTVMITLGVVIR
jgi:hypothetical protein